MSKEIDNKVVEMSFDNSKFEKNIQTSISSIDRLKQSLNFNGVTDGLDDINDSTKNVSSNFSGLTSGIEAAGKSFSAMEVIAITALANITNSAVNAGKRLVSSLSIDQVISGFSKYEEKTTSVQTIMNATGKTIEEVNDQLDKLVWFTDETSYSFTDMVSNIGKFTSNGIDLGVSVTAMMGIANWAALSGQNAEAASRAMYNLSQAIGVGAVKLQDWKSIENANMATKEFKEIAIETAKSLGYLKQNAELPSGTIVDASNFSSTLQEGWFTSDVLLAALDKYGNYSEEVYVVATEQGLTAADAMKKVSSETMELGSKAFKAAQEAKTFTDALNATKDAVSSGWMTTFETIFGNYEQAKVLWTDVANELYDVFAASAEGRNELLAEWAEIGGRDIFVESLMNSLQILKNVISAISEAWHDIFPEKTAEKLLSTTESFRNLTERLKNSTSSLNNFKSVLRGLFSILDVGLNLISAIVRSVKIVINGISEVISSVFNLTGSCFGLVTGLNNSIKQSDIFYKVLSFVANIIVKVINLFAQLISIVAQSKIFLAVSSLLAKAVQSIKNFVLAAKEKFSAPGFEFFHKLLEGLHNILSKVYSILSKVIGGIVSGLTSVSGAISGSTFFKVLSTIWKIIVEIGKAIFGVLGKSINWLFDKIKEGDLESFLEILKTIATGGIAVGIIKFINNISAPFKGLKDIIKGARDILDSVRGCFEAYQTKIKADALSKIAISVALLVAAILVLSFIDPNKIVGGVAAIGALLAEMVIALKLLGTFGKTSKKLLSSTLAMVNMSFAILILASALKKVSSIDSNSLKTGIIGIAALSAIVVATSKILSKDGKKVMKGAFQLILFGFAIKQLASTCVKLSKLGFNSMMDGLFGVALLMATMVGFVKLLGKPQKMISFGLGLIGVAIGIRILASSVKVLGKMSWEQMGVGLISFAGILGTLLVFLKLLGKPQKIIALSTGLIGISIGVRILASAIRALGKMSWEQMGVGLISFTGALLTLLTFFKLLGRPQKIITLGLGLIGVSTGIRILASALSKMGSMSWGSIAKGLVLLAGSLTILAIGLKAMKRTISGAAALLVAAMALLVLVPSLALLGAMSWESILKGLVGLAGAFLILGVAGLVLQSLSPAILILCGALALAGIALLAAGVGITALGVGMSALSLSIGTFSVAFAAAASSIVVGLKVIIEGFLSLIKTIAITLADGIVEFIKVIGEGAPIIIGAVKNIVLELLGLIRDVIPEAISVLGELLSALLTTLEARSEEYVTKFLGFIIGILNGIKNRIGELVNTLVDIFINLVDSLSKRLEDIINSVYDFFISLINSLANAIRNKTPSLYNAIKNLVSAIIESLKGIFKSCIDDLKEIGEDIINGLWNGIQKAWGWVKEKVEGIANAIGGFFKDILGIHSPSRVFAEFGRYIDEGLAIGLDKNSDVAIKSTENLGNGVIDTMSDAMTQVANILDDDLGDPTIRPVMDLTQIQNGANQLSRMMKDVDDYNLKASVDMAEKTSNSMSRNGSKDNYSSIDGLTKSINKMADNPSQNITLTFNVSGDNPKVIAEEVSRIIQKQVTRKGVVWG